MLKWSEVLVFFDKKISKWSKVKLEVFLRSLWSGVKRCVGTHVRDFGSFRSIFDRFWPLNPKFFARFARGWLLSHRCVLPSHYIRGKLRGFSALANEGALDCKRMLLFIIDIAFPQTPRRRVAPARGHHRDDCVREFREWKHDCILCLFIDGCKWAHVNTAPCESQCRNQDICVKMRQPYHNNVGAVSYTHLTLPTKRIV